MSIVRSIAMRLSEIEARARLTATQAEEINAKADYVAMMADVDLSDIESEDEE